MSKIRRGAKGRKKTKAIVTSVVAGGTALLVSLGIGIGALVNNIKANNSNFDSFEDDFTKPTFTETFDVESENANNDNIPSYETEETVKNPSHVTEDEYEEIVDDSRYQDLLASLTAKAQAHCAENRASLSKMEIVGLSNIKVEENQVALKGDFKNNTQFGNYIITLQNDQNADLKIFNIDEKQISVDDFISAINEVLNDSHTEFSLDARQRLVDFSQIDKVAVVQNITKGLSNSSEISNLTENIDNASFSLLLNDCIRNENGYQYSYTVAVHTQESIYVSRFTFESDKKLLSHKHV